MNRIVRFGFTPERAMVRAASMTTADPVPLSVVPVPRSQLSRWAPRMTTSPGRSLPRISPTVFHWGTGFRPSVFSILPSKRGVTLARRSRSNSV